MDLQDALDADEQAMDEPEGAAGDPADGDGLGVGEVREVQGEPERALVAAQGSCELVAAERAVLVGAAGAGQAVVDGDPLGLDAERGQSSR